MEDFVLITETKGLEKKKVDFIMSARQMNVHCIYITYVRMSETELVMYL